MTRSRKPLSKKERDERYYWNHRERLLAKKKAYNREYQKKNRERLKAKKREANPKYYQLHKEETKKRSLAWKRSHPEARRRHDAKYQKKNPEKTREYRRRWWAKWRKLHPGLVRVKKSKVRAELPDVPMIAGWQEDQMQEAYLAILEGRDPREAERQFRTKELHWIFSTRSFYEKGEHEDGTHEGH